MMNKMYFIKSKKGFTLVECVVALLLFSIITGAVLTVFSSSRRQIKQQNDQYKIDIMANNILAAYEGSNTSDSFEKRMTSLAINPNKTAPESDKQTIGTEGTGEYGFSTDNIPVAKPFSKIVVKDGAATFKDKDGNDMVSFAGSYPDNKLQNNETYDWTWSSSFNEAKNHVSSSMTLSGKAYPAVAVTSYDFSLVIDESNVKMKLGSMTDYISKPASDFDKYLLENGYFLQCKWDVQGSDYIIIAPTKYNYRFQVYNSDGTEVKVDGKNLYYCITVSAVSALATANADMASVISGRDNANSSYFDLENCTIKTYTGTSCPSYSSFKTELKDNGKSFTGKWYFMPWFVYKNDGNITPTCDEYIPGCDYYEYTPKESSASNIYYALTTPQKNEMLLFNSDGDLIFPYQNNAANALANLQNYGFGVDGSRNTRAVYKDTVYDKWYEQGSVPLWNVTRVKFVDGGSSGISKIIFYGKSATASVDSEYITFSYAKENYETFKSDRELILSFDSGYSNWYNYKKTYSIKSLKDISDAASLSDYANYNKIKEKGLGETTSDETLLYYTVSNSSNKGTFINPKYDHTYTYYSYKITTTKTVKLTNYKETSLALTVEKKGDDVTYTETISDSATVETTYSYTIAPQTNGTGTKTVTDSKKTPQNTPDEVKGGTKLTVKNGKTYDNNSQRLDYSNSQSVLEYYIKNKPTTSSDAVTGIVEGSTGTGVPADLDTKWNLTSEPTEAALHTVSALSSFIRNDDDSFSMYLGNEENSNLVFTAHTDDFVLAAEGVKASSTACTYDIIGGDIADIESKTYYITWTSNDVSLVSVATYSNYTKKYEIDGKEESREPMITIWSLPTSELPSNIKDITNDAYNEYVYSSYRKG